MVISFVKMSRSLVEAIEAAYDEAHHITRRINDIRSTFAELTELEDRTSELTFQLDILRADLIDYIQSKEEDEEEEEEDLIQEPIAPVPATPFVPPRRRNKACFYRALFNPEHRQKYDKFRRIWTAIRNTVYSAIGTAEEKETVKNTERDPNLTIDQLREMLRNLPPTFYPGSIQELLELLD